VRLSPRIALLQLRFVASAGESAFVVLEFKVGFCLFLKIAAISVNTHRITSHSPLDEASGLPPTIRTQFEPLEWLFPEILIN
jgi:hypothetical protein